MKKLCIAVMLLISTVGISQVTVFKYDTSDVILSEVKWDVETTYSSVKNELILTVRELGTENESKVFYRILEVTQSTNNIAWTCYKGMDAKGYYINHTFFYEGKNELYIHYNGGNYSRIVGGGLVY